MRLTVREVNNLSTDLHRRIEHDQQSMRGRLKQYLLIVRLTLMVRRSMATTFKPR